MKYVLVACTLVTLAVALGFTVQSVYLQAIDNIILKLVDNLELADFNVLKENVEAYNNHLSDFLRKLTAKDPSFRTIAIEHCKEGEPKFPNEINIHAFQLNLGWNDTQAGEMFKVVNTTRHLWMAYEERCHDANYARYVDKFSATF